MVSSRRYFARVCWSAVTWGGRRVRNGHEWLIRCLRSQVLAGLGPYRPRKSLRPVGGTAGEEGVLVGTSVLGGWSSPCLGSGRWCRPCPWHRQSLRSQGDTSPRIWKQGTWRSHQPAAAASWGLGGPDRGTSHHLETGVAGLLKSWHFWLKWPKRLTKSPTWRKRSMIPTVMYIVSCSRRNLRFTCTSQSMRMARMFPVTSLPCR